MPLNTQPGSCPAPAEACADEKLSLTTNYKADPVRLAFQMTRNEFQVEVRKAFAFMQEYGFAEAPMDSDPESVVYSKEDFVITIKWEDYGTYICGIVERENFPGSFDLNAFIEFLSPTHHRKIRPGHFPENFSREEIIRYLAGTLELIMDEFWSRRHELWSAFVTRLEAHRRSEK